MTTSATPHSEPRGASSLSIADRIEAIRSGNQHRREPRCLALVRGEYWETRTVPAKPHHFTGKEFEAYLWAQRFPPNTIEDRIRHHVQVIRRALLDGQFVPVEVLNDESGKAAVADAGMDVRAAREAEFARAQTEDATRHFEIAIGCHQPHGRPDAVMREMLIRAAKGVLHPGYSSFNTLLARGHKQVSVDGYPRALWLAACQGQNRASWISIRDTGWHLDSLYGEIYRVPFSNAETVYREGLIAGVLTPSEVSSVMGTSWHPFLRVTRVDSAALANSV